MKKQTVSCKIEHHAVLFALLAKYAIQECGDEGREAILAGMTAYGNGTRNADGPRTLSPTEMNSPP